MAEGTYEYECMRAELLGVEKPDYEEFVRKKAEQQEQQPLEDDIEAVNLRDAELGSEGMGRISGGLDELNSILQNTQKKINKFKASCGSLTNLLRIKIGQGGGPSGSPETSDSGGETSAADGDSCTAVAGSSTGSQPATPSMNGERKSDLSRALDNHVDQLDTMINKAEYAQLSMEHQTKQMKKFLN